MGLQFVMTISVISGFTEVCVKGNIGVGVSLGMRFCRSVVAGLVLSALQCLNVVPPIHAFAVIVFM